jgi:hypothetical protein
MKLKVILSILITAIVLTFSACSSDFLQYTAYGTPTSDQFWKTSSDLQSAVDGLYFWTGMEPTTGRGFMWYENASDNMITGRDKAGAAILKNFTETGNTDRDVTGEWPNFYQLIHRCNDVLLNAPKMNVPAAQKTEAMGEGYFFRGFAYLWLAPWYGDIVSGGIPIMLPTTPVDSIDMPRPSSVLKNYAMIISDFQKAAAMVPYLQDRAVTDYGRPHKTACWGFIARAALYAAQYDPTYFTICSNYCDSIINSNRNSLVAKYSDFFTPAQNYGPEYLWNFPSNQLEGSELPGVMFENGGWGKYNTWGYYQPTLELYNEFEQGDSRRSATIAMPGDVLSFIGTNNIVYAVNPLSVSSPSIMACSKYLAPFAGADCVGKSVNTNGDFPTTTLCPPVLRYADILLMKAEAMIWTGQNGDTWLNQVRNRAGLASKTGATKADLKHERRCEFAFEPGPWRYLDVVRWGDASTLLSAPLHGLMRRADGVTIANWKVASPGTYSGYKLNPDSVNVVWAARTYNSYNDVFAIPYGVMQLSKTLVQNHGY